VPSQWLHDGVARRFGMSCWLGGYGATHFAKIALNESTTRYTSETVGPGRRSNRRNAPLRFGRPANATAASTASSGVMATFSAYRRTSSVPSIVTTHS